MKVKTLGVIPARFGAQRFPGKPLTLIAGKPLVQHVYEHATHATNVDMVVVATEDTRILETVEGFGGTAVLTSPDCATGTDRVAEVARQYDCNLVVNIQGDEPLMRPEMIDQLVEGMEASSDCVMGTLACQLGDPKDVFNPTVVKVVIRENGDALYFSRSTIPYVREGVENDPVSWMQNGKFLKHLGIYAYRRDFLFQFVQLSQTDLEKTEKLEQLRAVEHGVVIRVWITPYDSIGVDRPEDVKTVEAILEKRT